MQHINHYNIIIIFNVYIRHLEVLYLLQAIVN
jgi:hypothetical protein